MPAKSTTSKNSADSYIAVERPTGTAYAAFSDRGISFAMLAKDAKTFERAFTARFDRPVTPSKKSPPALVHALQTGSGERKLTYDLEGLTDFQRSVLNKTREVPRGEVRPYGWIAREIGHPRAVRAVGSALGSNPVPLLIPCHRIIRSDGTIGNYGFGTEAKRSLLAEEGVVL